MKGHEPPRSTSSWRRLQIPQAAVQPYLPLRPLLPLRRPQEIRQSPQSLRRQQRRQNPRRGARKPARRRRQFPCLRGGGAAEGPRLRLHRRHCSPAAQDRRAAAGAHRS